jgi:hypothetical protein
MDKRAVSVTLFIRNVKARLGIVVHVYNPNYARGISRRIMVQGWSRQKASEK